MSTLNIPWHPRILYKGRRFRLPVQNTTRIDLSCPGFVIEHKRFSVHENAWFFYLRAPENTGDYTITAISETKSVNVTIRICSLRELRTPHKFNGEYWPRRWPLGKDWTSQKKRQTLQYLPAEHKENSVILSWWLNATDRQLWKALPPAELPQAHYVNVTNGCPQCGTAIFAHHGFYPWIWPCLGEGGQAQCPSCGFQAPPNDPSSGDWYNDSCVDDGFGLFDKEGNVFLFAATYHRNQVISFGSGITTLTQHMRNKATDADAARRLALMLIRYAEETLYVATAAQFRYGPSKEREEPWEWGQPDWTNFPDPKKSLYRKGLLRYSIDVPIIAKSISLAFDTIWPYLCSETVWVASAQAQGSSITDREDGLLLIEEMLSVQLQCLIDGGGLSNFPRASIGALTILQALDRGDAIEPMDWLYDRGQERLRTFSNNNFFPDGTPPEATGGYNDTHSMGLFELEEQLQRLRLLHPKAYPEKQYPSLLKMPRALRIACAPYETVMVGRAILGFGDGASSGVQGELPDKPYEPYQGQILQKAQALLIEKKIKELVVKPGTYRQIGTTVHDGVGFTILRTQETPERAAAGIVYGDSWLHRHMDLLDVQLFAYGRPFLSDLGYPQSWASVGHWEGHWATHNTAWGIIPEIEPLQLKSDTPYYFLKALGGRGKLVRLMEGDGLQAVEVEAERWAWDMKQQRWMRPGVHLRRLVALIETDNEGVALVDFMRVRGGTQHWRTCRGLEGSLHTQTGRWTQKTGTAADQNIKRGETRNVSHPDLSALAFMDQVCHYDGPDAWHGCWISNHEPHTKLDIHQVSATTGTQVMSARSTATMGEPEDSNYKYHGLLWKRNPTSEKQESHTDLVFEPRVNANPKIATVSQICGDSQTSGVNIKTCCNRTISIYWAPYDTGTPSVFHDGTMLYDGIGIVVDGKAKAMAKYFQPPSKKILSSEDSMNGYISSLDRTTCQIEIKGINKLTIGTRITVNPLGRGHTYKIEDAIQLGNTHWLLTLDTDSLLGQGLVRAVENCRLHIDHFVNARTGNLHGTRLQLPKQNEYYPIIEAMNPDAESTIIVLEKKFLEPALDCWIEVVDYVIGDIVSYHPLLK